MTSVRIREARVEDAANILELYREAGIGPEEAFTPEQAQVQLEVFRKYPNYRVFVAELNGIVVGTYELLIMDNLAKRGRKSAIVEDLAVAESNRGRGIGRLLMQHAMQQAQTTGCYKLVLSSNLRREGAHAFYENLGFEKHGYSFVVSIP